jgi:hypothetical protein
MPKYPSGTVAAERAIEAAHAKRTERNKKRRHQRDSIAHGRQPLSIKERMYRRMPVLRWGNIAIYRMRDPLPRHRRRGSKR